VANGDNYSVTGGQTLTVIAPGVLGNDTDLQHDPLTARLTNLPRHGTLAFSGDGSFIYVPNPGFSGTDTFTYAAYDVTSNLAGAQATVTIMVAPAPPVAYGGNYSVTGGQTLTIPAPGVLGNDSDLEHDPLTARVIGLPSHGRLALAGDGSFTYVPAPRFSGSDSFTYTAYDQATNLASAPATVTITVAPTPTPTFLGEFTLTAGKGRKKQVIGWQLNFSAPLDAGAAQNIGNYHVVQPRRSKHSAPKGVRVLSATYNPGNNSVMLVLGKSTAGKPLMLTATGLVGAAGSPVATIITALQ
jgi:hypothetical protein